VTGDRERLAQAIINLVENALRHTPEGSRIALTARSEEVEVVLTVSDDGPGIAEGDRERVQQRFVRLEAARSTDGHGLGLSLVRAIADMHGAKFVLGDAAPGLVAQIRLPQRATK
jgi:signal transduction histidine kinase